MDVINIENEEQLKELFKTGVRVGEKVIIDVSSDLEGTIEVWGELLVMWNSKCKNITAKAYHHSRINTMNDTSINVIALNGSTVDASGNTKVKVCGDAKVKVSRNAIVEHNDIGHPIIGAYGNASVRARGGAIIEAYGKAEIEAHGGAFVRAFNNSSVKAYDGVIVDAYNSTTVEAYDKAIVRAYGEANVSASETVKVIEN